LHPTPLTSSQNNSAGELDTLVSSIPNASLITSPVFGAPAAADKAQLIIIMSGDYRSKKEVAFMFVPAIGRKVVDLGENVEKGYTLLVSFHRTGTYPEVRF
jgi:3-hydroxyisobutyrate dehydrogenase-like beta-hydroxyacid dehydrogenase